MCNYIYVGPPSAHSVNRELTDPAEQKELSCQHHYHLVESWCPKYIETQRRCPPTIVSKQYWGDDICAACRERRQPSNHPWAKLIQRPSSTRLPTYPSYPSYPSHLSSYQISAR